MVYDPEFCAGQAYLGVPRDLNPDFDKFCLYSGLIRREDEPLLIGKMRTSVQAALGWPTNRIHGTWDFAIKANCEHELSFSLFALAPMVISHGDTFTEPYRGHGLTVVFALRLSVDQPYWFYMPCKLDKGGNGIFARTMWLRKISAGKWKQLRPLHIH